MFSSRSLSPENGELVQVIGNHTVCTYTPFNSELVIKLLTLYNKFVFGNYSNTVKYIRSISLGCLHVYRMTHLLLVTM